MLTITKGSIIRLEYQLQVKGGEIIESSAKDGFIRYTHGEGQMLPALESRLEGLSVGDEKAGVIPAAEAFPEKDMPTKDIPRREFPAEEKLEVGKLFQATGPDGTPLGFQVIEATADVVKVRLLPALAGKDLEFKVKVLGIDDPKTQRREGIAPPPPPADALDLVEE